ncbi:MAG: cytochrome c [Rhodospirillales bacterium]|nr:cytochrome c [Rhodospirillales bacterium]
MTHSASWTTRIVIACGCALVSSAAFADQAKIDYRKSVMEAIGGHTSALAAIIRGNVPYTEDASVHAKAIAPLAKLSTHIFPEDSKTGKTEALAAIWEKPDAFKKAMDSFQEAADKLALAADDEPKVLAAALGGLGKTCKGCHDDFREKDKD